MGFHLLFGYLFADRLGWSNRCGGSLRCLSGRLLAVACCPGSPAYSSGHLGGNFYVELRRHPIPKIGGYGVGAGAVDRLAKLDPAPVDVYT